MPVLIKVLKNMKTPKDLYGKKKLKNPLNKNYNNS